MTNDSHAKNNQSVMFPITVNIIPLSNVTLFPGKWSAAECRYIFLLLSKMVQFKLLSFTQKNCFKNVAPVKSIFNRSSALLILIVVFYSSRAPPEKIEENFIMFFLTLKCSYRLEVWTWNRKGQKWAKRNQMEDLQNKK